LAAAAAGVVASLHCAGMCAPLSCALFRTCTGAKTVSYHGARAFSYTSLGALLGAMGAAAAGVFTSRIAHAVPLALALLFIAMAFGFDRAVPQPAFLRRIIGALHLGSGKAANGAAGPGMLGLVTPLIPCGPLYLMLGIALISGSALRGAGIMLCFAAGTMPIYLLAQWQWFHLSARMSPRMLRTTQKVLACLSALIVAWRAFANGGLGLALPFCH
jgi:hypothetical protein